MKEDFLHYLWRTRRFDLSDLYATDGRPLLIVEPGEYNRHAGPDFLHARVRIDDTLWAGNVEMHLRASEWLQHGHQHDAAYDNVILHVVLEEDKPIFRANGERIACLELKRRIPPRLSGTYLQLLHAENWIPCQRHFGEVDNTTKMLWLDRLLVERLEEKTERLAARLEAATYDWEEVFYQSLAANFGTNINAAPFDVLARSLPLKLLSKHRNSLLQIEALIFGQAGMLDETFADEYPRRLSEEYRFLKKKYKLTPIEPAMWKFLRLRPANFPTVRLAQLSALLFGGEHLFSKTLAAADFREIERLFNLRVSLYWLDHYVFDKPSIRRPKPLGHDAIHLITANTIVPFLFLYGAHKHEERYKEKALQLLEALPAEANHVMDGWKKLDCIARNAYQSQALLQLKQKYCDRKRCLECAIGNAIMK
ncbi:MAG: DUF2851 family protein [Saprospiraceae bacterium]|nr:DUF2851 family protein [Saprospiraceae bacterium]